MQKEAVKNLSPTLLAVTPDRIIKQLSAEFQSTRTQKNLELQSVRKILLGDWERSEVSDRAIELLEEFARNINSVLQQAKKLRAAA